MLLLDSQTVLWALDGNPRLGVKARGLIENETPVHVSAATIWELTIKSMFGKLTLPDKFADRLAGQGFAELPVTSEAAEGIREFPELVRHDPFDRLIASQALIHGLRLLTADAVLLDLGRRYIVDSRI